MIDEKISLAPSIEKQTTSPEVAKEAREKAVAYAIGLDASSNGYSPLDLGPLTDRAISGVKNKKADLDLYDKLTFDPFNMKASAQIVDQETISVTPYEAQQALRALERGLAGEILSKRLQPNECATYSTNTKIEQIKDYSVIDPQDYLKTKGPVRKDILLAEYFIDTSDHEPVEDKLLVKKSLLNTLNNYQEVFRNWRLEKPERNRIYPSLKELVIWSADSENQDTQITKKQRTARNRLIEEVLQFTSSSDKKTVESRVVGFDNGTHPPISFYDNTILPDHLIVDQADSIVGAVEVKSYTPLEFSDLVGQLELYLHTETSSNPNEKVEEIDQIVTSSAGLGRKGLQVFVTPKGTGGSDSTLGMRLGTDVDGLRRMVSVINKNPTSVDVIDSTTAEVSINTNYLKEYPVIIRVPSDIHDEDITRFFVICDKLSYKNIFIQKLPFTSEDINTLAGRYIERYVNQPNVVKSKGYKTLSELDSKTQGVIKSIE